jgi:hypothetical protein
MGTYHPESPERLEVIYQMIDELSALNLVKFPSTAAPGNRYNPRSVMLTTSWLRPVYNTFDPTLRRALFGEQRRVLWVGFSIWSMRLWKGRFAMALLW